jgi:hypothetical protein
MDPIVVVRAAFSDEQSGVAAQAGLLILGGPSPHSRTYQVPRAKTFQIVVFVFPYIWRLCLLVISIHMSEQ